MFKPRQINVSTTTEGADDLKKTRHSRNQHSMVFQTPMAN